MTVKDRLKIYYNLLLIRNVEEAIVERYHPADKMRCPIHLCIRQELAPAVLNLLLKLRKHQENFGWGKCLIKHFSIYNITYILALSKFRHNISKLRS